MKINLKISILFLALNLSGFAQQQSMFSEFHNQNTYAINSASSALLEAPEFFLASNITNMNMPGHPTSLYASGVWTFNHKNFALGLSYTNDKVGVFSDNSLKLSYAYRLNFNNDHRNYSNTTTHLYEHSLALSINGGIRFATDNLLDLNLNDDPILNQNQSITNPVFGVSAFYNHPNFFVGLSLDNFIKSDKKDNLNTTINEQDTPLYVYTGYRFSTMNDRLLVTPNILLRHNFQTPIIIDYNLNLDYNNAVLATIGYRDSGAINLSLGIKLFDKKLDLSCMANIYTKSNFFNNTLGLTLKYKLLNTSKSF